MAKLKRPLKAAAVREADTQFYDANPSYLSPSGERLPIPTSDPKTAEWREYYLGAGGELESEDSPATSQKEAGSATQECEESAEEILFTSIQWELPPDELEDAGCQLVYPKSQSAETLGLRMSPGSEVGIYLELSEEKDVCGSLELTLLVAGGEEVALLLRVQE